MAKIAVLLGSLRKESLNRKLAAILADKLPAGNEIEIIEGLGDLPFYSEDTDGDNAPANITKVRDEISKADGLIFITPQNNGTIPAVLKNVIDWASRPYGSGSIKDKPFIVFGTSLGAEGGSHAIADTETSAKIAGGKHIEGANHAIPSSSFNNDNPQEHEETVSKVEHVLDTFLKGL